MEHPYRQCPAFGRMCYYCNNMNQFECACRARIRDQGEGHGFVNRGQGSGRVSQGRGGRSLSRGGQSSSRGSSSGRGNMNYNQVHAVHTEDYSENEGLYNSDSDINAGASGNLSHNQYESNDQNNDQNYFGQSSAEYETPELYSLCVDVIETQLPANDPWKIAINVDKNTVQMKIDMGAQHNLQS